MSSVIARRVTSTPSRSAGQTWERIVSLVAPEPTSVARAELAKAAGVASAAIASEAIKDDPIVVWGDGPRVRIYCVFGDDAITGDDVSEGALTGAPTEGDWRMSIPCLPEDVAWSQKRLSSVSKRISVRAIGEDVPDEETKAAAPRSFSINPKEFLKS